MTNIFLAPASRQQGDSRAYKHLQRTVVRGIPSETYSQHTSKEFMDRVGIWGLVHGSRYVWNQIEPGDILLFYVGDEQYEYAAEVLDKEENRELANHLWPDFGREPTGGDDPGTPWEFLIFLGEPVEVDIDGRDVHKSAGHENNYPSRHFRLNDSGTRALKDEYGSIEAFIEAKRVEDGGGTSEDQSERVVDVDEQADDLHPPDRIDVTISRVIRNTTLSKQLKRRYAHRCQVCGDRREKGTDQPYSEVHHLHPLGHDPPGPDVEENMLVLCPNHHADFDYGTIQFESGSLRIHHDYEEQTDGVELTIRDDHSLSSEFLEYHNQMVSQD